MGSQPSAVDQERDFKAVVENFMKVLTQCDKVTKTNSMVRIIKGGLRIKQPL